MKKISTLLFALFIISACSDDDINNAADIAFLEENAKRADVTVTSSGLQYRIIREGEGDKPKITDEVSVHYRGRLIDDTVFDSSYQRGTPAVFPLNGVIRGFAEGIMLMNPDAEFEIFIPADLAYGNNPPLGTPIYRGATLIFEIELLEIL